MAGGKPLKNRTAALSPAAKCWWQQIGDCIYLVIAASDGVASQRRRLTITDKEAYVLRKLLTDPDWWQDHADLNARIQGDK